MRSAVQSPPQAKSDGADVRQTKTAQLATLDAPFALHIALARRAFHEVQRHGYAQGYALVGYSEQATRSAASDYYVELVLHATRDATSGVEAKTGTGTRRRRDDAPLRVEVQLLLDAQRAWQSCWSRGRGAWRLT